MNTYIGKLKELLIISSNIKQILCSSSINRFLENTKPVNFVEIGI